MSEELIIQEIKDLLVDEKENDAIIAQVIQENAEAFTELAK